MIWITHFFSMRTIPLEILFSILNSIMFFSVDVEKYTFPLIIQFSWTHLAVNIVIIKCEKTKKTILSGYKYGRILVSTRGMSTRAQFYPLTFLFCFLYKPNHNILKIIHKSPLLQIRIKRIKFTNFFSRLSYLPLWFFFNFV